MTTCGGLTGLRRSGERYEPAPARPPGEVDEQIGVSPDHRVDREAALLAEAARPAEVGGTCSVARQPHQRLGDVAADDRAGSGRRSRRPPPAPGRRRRPVATTGRATDIASSTDIGSASTALVRHTTSAACMMSRASARNPITRTAPPERSAARRTAGTVRPVADDEARDRRLGGMCRGHLLDERPWPASPGEARPRAPPGRHARPTPSSARTARAVPHRRDRRHAVWDHSDRVAAVAVAHQVLRLCCGHGDDRASRAAASGRSRAAGAAGAAACPRGSGPRCSVTTWAARCRRASAGRPGAHSRRGVTTADDDRPASRAARARPTGRRGAAGPRTRRAAAATQLLEVDAAAVERHHARRRSRARRGPGRGAPTAARRRPPRGSGRRTRPCGPPLRRHRSAARRGGGDRRRARARRSAAVRRPASPRADCGSRPAHSARLDGRRERRRVARHDRASGKAGDHGGDVADRDGDDRRLAGERLLHDHRRALPHRRHDGHIRGVHRQGDPFAGEPVEAGGEYAREPRPAAGRPSRRRRRTRLSEHLGAVAARRGKKHAGPARGQPSARRASARSTGANRSRSTAHGNHRRVAHAEAGGDHRRDGDRLGPSRDQPGHLCAATAPMRRCRGMWSRPVSASCRGATAPDSP